MYWKVSLSLPPTYFRPAPSNTLFQENCVDPNLREEIQDYWPIFELLGHILVNVCAEFHVICILFDQVLHFSFLVCLAKINQGGTSRTAKLKINLLRF
jgi:hypothetical protein